MKRDAIKGWCDYEDFYANIAENAKDGDLLVEVGSFLGSSAVFLAQHLKERGVKAHLICVDLWPGPNLWHFQSNVWQSGLRTFITPLHMSSVKAANIVRDDLSFVFLDGDHRYDGVREDINAWLPKIRRGGILAGHDFNRTDYPGVVRAVEESFGGEFKRVSFQCWKVDV